MDNWLYYIVVAGFFAISQVMEERRKQAKKEGQSMAPPTQTKTKKSSQKPQRKSPTNTPDTLDDVLAEMLGIPKRKKPAKQQATKSTKPSTNTTSPTQKNTPTPSFKSSVPTQAKPKTQAQTTQEESYSVYAKYDKPKSVADERKAPNNQTSSTKTGSVNLRQAVIYQTILERKYS